MITLSVLAELLQKREERQAKRDEVQRDLDALVASLHDDESGTDRALTSEEEQRSNDLLEKRAKHDDKLAALDSRIEEENKQAATQRMLAEARKNAGLTVETRHDGNGADMSVESEPKTYGYGSPNSYFADLYYTSGIKFSPTSPQYRAALDRQFRWSNEVEHEIADQTKFGRFAEKQFREHYRSPQGDNNGMSPGSGPDYRKIYRECRERGRVGLSDKGLPGVEMRALTTGGGATASAAGGGAAAFVTPIFTEGDYVPFREFGRAFADETTQRPLPPYGMTIYMPIVTSGEVVSTAYAEGTGVTDTEAAQGFITAGLTIIAGQATTSQAVLDRTGPNFEYDVVIWDQLERDYAPKWDIYVITAALASALTQTYNGTFKVAATSGVGGLYGQVALAKATMRTTEGTVLNPNRVFMDPIRWEAVAAWGDAQGRPIVVPNYAGAFNAAAAGSADGDAGIEGPTGYRFAGLPAFTDHNLPTTGGTANQDQVIVCDSTQTWSYEGAPVHRVLPQTQGGNLNVIFQQYSYGAVLQRYVDAVVKIAGTALVPPNFNQ